MRIVFVHNVFDRPKTLHETISKEKKYFPQAKIIIAYNNENIDFSLLKSSNYWNDVECIYFKHETHKIGCANGFILGVQRAITKDCDVIFFSHDDVSINVQFLDVFQKNLTRIYDKSFDVICRSPKNNYGTNYYMMEGIFISRNKAEHLLKNVKIYEDEKLIPKDVRNSISPEVFLYNLLNKSNVKIQNFIYDNSSDIYYNYILGETMGIYHKNIGLRGWKDN